MSERIEQVWFEGSAGDQLAARLDLPGDDPVAYALFAHCFTRSTDAPAATQISRGLVDRGIGVLRFDFTGLGASDGEVANTNFESNIEDLVRAADLLRQRHEAPKILVGHSLAGSAVLAAAGQITEAVGVVTIGAPFDPAKVASFFPNAAAAALQGSGQVTLEIGGRPFTIRSQLIKDVNARSLTVAIGALHRALLVFHAPRDEIVDIDNARRIFEAAKHPKSFVSLDDADHLLTRQADADYVAEVLAAWVGRYLGAPVEQHDATGDVEGTVVVSDFPPGRLAQVVQAGGHSLIADEPTGVGDDLGPTPYDLLLASLGACTAMTIRLYAARKHWPLEHISIHLTHDRVHAEDARDCESESCMIDHIERVVDLTGPLTDEQCARLLEIAERCPVHRTLMGDLRIVTVLGDGVHGPLTPTVGRVGTSPTRDHS
jgi:putative redox protein